MQHPQHPPRRRAHADDDHDDDVYLTLTELAAYSRLSTATLKRFLADPVRPLPHLQIRTAGKDRGRLLFDRAAVDRWLQSFRPEPVEPAEPPAAVPATANLDWIRRELKL